MLSAVRLPGDLAKSHRPRSVRRRAGRAARRSSGYLEEDGIPPTSTTETFAAVKLEIDTRRWAGVPFYLRTGKRLGRRVSEIAVVFKRAPHLPFERTATEELGQNALVIRVQPDEGVTMRFGSKVPGTAMEVRDVTMDFGYGHAFTESSPEAYERLILDVLLGDPPLFPRQEEVELSWKILDPIEGHWARSGRPEQYESGHLGADVRRRDDGPRRPGLEDAVIIDLPGTTTAAINRKLVDLREGGGAIALGRVLTLVIVTDEHEAEEAIEAANSASHEHPCRVIVVVQGNRRGVDRLDAQIRVGGDAGASEVLVLRLYGQLADARRQRRARRCCCPTPPSSCGGRASRPTCPPRTRSARMAQRRITDAADGQATRARSCSRLAKVYRPATPTWPGPG